MCECLYLGNARDDIWVFGGVVFLVAAEYSNLAALQNVNLQGRNRNKHKKINETDSDSQKSDLTIKSSRWMSDVMHASEGRAAQ